MLTISGILTEQLLTEYGRIPRPALFKAVRLGKTLPCVGIADFLFLLKKRLLHRSGAARVSAVRWSPGLETHRK